MAMLASPAHIGAGASPWQWHAHPDVWLLIVALTAGYLAALRYLGPRKAPPGEPPATTKQKLLFFAGVALLWLAADWPMHDLSEGPLFSAHMVQHLVFAFGAPPLLLLGTPRWLLRLLLAPPAVTHVVRFATRPVPALLIFNAAIVLVHSPQLVTLQVSSEIGHFVVHTLFVLSALFMWWPVIGPLPEMPALHQPAAMFYLFLQSIVPTVPASFLTFARAPIYKAYEGILHPFGLSTVMDQTIAGLTMKLGGGLLLWSIITVMFFRWHAREESGQVEEVPWDDFERELQAWDLRR